MVSTVQFILQPFVGLHGMRPIILLGARVLETEYKAEILICIFVLLFSFWPIFMHATVNINEDIENLKVNMCIAHFVLLLSHVMMLAACFLFSHHPQFGIYLIFVSIVTFIPLLGPIFLEDKVKYEWRKSKIMGIISFTLATLAWFISVDRLTTEISISAHFAMAFCLTKIHNIWMGGLSLKVPEDFEDALMPVENDNDENDQFV